MMTLKDSQNNSYWLTRGLRIGSLVVFFVVVVSGAISVPFVYESQTLWYKIGADKTMLRAGKIVGLFAVIQLLVQILLGVRGQFFEKLFGVAGLMRWHRANGVFILVLVLCHVSLVLIPEGISNLPIGKKYWPEMVGILLLWIILSMVISSQFRQQLGFAYIKWRKIHKLLGYFALILACIHVLFVSESFEHIVPRTVLIAAVTMVGIIVLRIKFVAFRKRR